VIPDIGTPADLHQVLFPVDNESGLVVGSGGTVMRTNDRGYSWIGCYCPTSEDVLDLDFRPYGSVGCACGRSGTILLTTDGGASWVAPASIEL